MPTFADLGFATLADYQRFHGIADSGELDSITQRSLTAPRFCGLPDNMALGGQILRWGKKVLRYGFTGKLPGIELEDMRRAFQIAFDRWSAVCDLKASHIGDSGEAADIVIGTGRIDGVSGTLAWSELPAGSQDRQLKQLYDHGEPWVIADKVPAYRIDLIRVACHELGHAIGIEHIGPGNLLAPVYSNSINKPQPGDITEAIRRYGPPRVQPPPATPGGDDEEFIMVKLPRAWVSV